MAEEDSLVSYDKDDTLKNTSDDMTIMSAEDSIGCVYGKLVLLGKFLYAAYAVNIIGDDKIKFQMFRRFQLSFITAWTVKLFDNKLFYFFSVDIMVPSKAVILVLKVVSIAQR
ncbi:unnamed protein product [Onchocerca ochengi]|uniref:Bestrophin homolog n=1 Tax=Onchocerca ochengi TaxID=42157 RepID=A0A182EX62_ONCOC|nr:unnamed protein product [Onchocerca ochengi]